MLLVVVFVALAATIQSSQAASPPSEQGLTVLGGLPSPTFPTLLGVAPGSNKLLMAYATSGEGWYLRIFDATQELPRFERDVSIGALSDFPAGITARSLAFDSIRPIMYLLTTVSPRGGGSASEFGPVLKRIDVKTFKPIDVVDLQSALPGFIPYALTYSPEDDRIYLLGDISSGHGLLSLNGVGSDRGARPAAITQVVSIDPTGSMRVVWTRIVPQCQQPAYEFLVGSLIARSRFTPSLYFPCMRTSYYPGLSGVVRLGTKKDATTAEAANFSVQFYPIPGNFTTQEGNKANTAFDPGTDRLFLQSLAPKTLGSWVFDGKRSGWVGSVTTRDLAEFLGVSPLTGHLYMGSAVSGTITVSDGRATPTPQGLLFPVTPAHQATIITDPNSARLFVEVDDLSAYHAGPKADGYLVLRDDTPLALPLPVVNYDDLTTGGPEGPTNGAIYSSDIEGFGMRATAVGGYGGVLSIRDGDSTFQGQLSTVPRNFAGLSPGDRGFFAARVDGLDVRGVGAAAGASALSRDPLTDNDYASQQKNIRAQQDQQTAPIPEAVRTPIPSVADSIEWPWPEKACLDASGSKATASQDSPNGRAAVECNLAGSSATADATMRAIGVDASSVNISVAKASFHGEAFRSKTAGMMGHAIAETDGLKIETPAGTLTIQRIRSDVTTTAHGMAGTAKVDWARTFEGVRIADANGKDQFVCDTQCDPQAVVDQANSQLETHVRFLLPKPDQRETPKGAFAGFHANEADHFQRLTVNNDTLLAVPALEVIVMNDTVQKSRLDLQFAALESSSVYAITALPADVLGTQFQAPLPPVTVTVPGAPQIQVVQQLVYPPAQNFVQRLAQGALLIIRSPKDAFFVGLIGLLFAITGAAGRSRRRLVEMLENR